MVSTVHRKMNDLGVCLDDKRGRHHNRPNKASESKLEEVRAHIQSFKTIESHYCRKDSKKLYLPPELSITKMYRLYKEKYANNAVSESVYRSVFCNDFNLSFYHPKKDQCDFCRTYANSSLEDKEKIQDAYDRHIANKELARKYKDDDKQQYKTDQDPDTIVCCFDLEQILLTPHSFESCLYYKRKLNSFNFTIYDLCTSEGSCFLWNETIAKRGACEMASCLHNFIQGKANKGVKNFIFYSDNCMSQNKNRYYVSMLWYCLNKYKLESITHKYLEKGHTQNEGDSIHSSVESASRHVPVYTTSQWATLVRSARHNRPYKVQEMTLKDFFDFKQLAVNVKNFEITTDNQKVKWHSIKVLKLNFSEPNQFQFQTDYDGDVFSVDLFHRTRHSIPKPSKIKLEQLRGECLPIPKAKYIDLVSLCQTNIIPRAHDAFYLLLPHE